MILERLIPTGLRLRLTLWVALVLVCSFAVTVVAVYRGTGTQIRHDVDKDVSGDLVGFSRALEGPQPHSAAQVARVASRYVTEQPFSANSTLLFALVPGHGTKTNQPELFARAVDDGETAAQQAVENRLNAQLLTVGDGFNTVELADVGKLRLLKQRVRIGKVRVTLGAGEPLAIVAHAQSGVVRAFVLAGALALGIALLASLIVGARVSAPLRRMAAVAARVDGGDLHPRIHVSGSRHDEVRVLGESFNHMLDRLTTAFAAQRAFVADASHELRTPLTVIAGQLEVLASQSAPEPAEIARVERLVRGEVTRLSRLADDLLLLVQVEQSEFLQPEAIELAPYIDDLWEGVSATADRRFELGSIPDGVLRADPDRLAQALRNLLRNAIEHTRPDEGLVALDVERDGREGLRLTVSDDGPGIAPAQRERIFDRFYRTDSARSRARGGTGLGLAIVRAIAEAHGGSVSAGEREGGGARIAIELPGFEAGRDDVRAEASAREALR